VTPTNMILPVSASKYIVMLCIHAIGKSNYTTPKTFQCVFLHNDELYCVTFSSTLKTQNALFTFQFGTLGARAFGSISITNDLVNLIRKYFIITCIMFCILFQIKPSNLTSMAKHTDKNSN